MPAWDDVGWSGNVGRLGVVCVCGELPNSATSKRDDSRGWASPPFLEHRISRNYKERVGALFLLLWPSVASGGFNKLVKALTRER